MSKKINQDSMSVLFNGLTKADNSTTQTEVSDDKQATMVSERKEVSLRREKLCTLVESDVLSKVRVIAEEEGISIASMVNLGLKVVLENYEKNHGKIKAKSTKKRGNIDEVFDI